jgi:hypothetical protein
MSILSSPNTHKPHWSVEALKPGLNIAGDVVQGRNIKQAAKSRLKSTGQNLFRKLWTRYDHQDNEL